jgi:protein ImuA
MQFVSTADGVLRVRKKTLAIPMRPSAWRENLSALAELLPCDGLRNGAVHEILGAGDALPWSFALLLAHTAANDSPRRRAVVWCDPRGELFPPAVATALPPGQLFLLRAGDPRDELWAVAQCLRCPAVAAAVASPMRLDDIQARRLQLAAEQGGGIGLLLRRDNDSSRAHYAAATRWLVRPAPGDERVQRWSVQLIHGHGGQIGKKTIFLEISRDAFRPDHVRAVDALADRSDSASSSRASA